MDKSDEHEDMQLDAVNVNYMNDEKEKNEIID